MNEHKELEILIKEKEKAIPPEQKIYCDLWHLKQKLETKAMHGEIIVEIQKLVFREWTNTSSDLKEIKKDINNLFIADREAKDNQEKVGAAIIEISKTLKTIKEEIYGKNGSSKV